MANHTPMRALDFIIRRLFTAVFVLLGVSIITFFLARVIPSDAAALYIGPKARAADIERVRKQLGLDEPLPVQYAIYMSELLHGDLGNSISTKRPVLQEITERVARHIGIAFVCDAHCLPDRHSAGGGKRPMAGHPAGCLCPHRFHLRRVHARVLSRLVDADRVLSEFGLVASCRDGWIQTCDLSPPLNHSPISSLSIPS